jgi:branched-chain amino acid transport system substrate-binding protein
LAPLKKAIIICGLVLSALAVVGAADRNPIRFEQALALMNQGKFQEAEGIFSELLSTATNPELLHTYLFYKAKAEYYVGNIEKSFEDFKKLTSVYARSPYLPYAYFFMGNIQFRQADGASALDSYMESYSLSTDQELDYLLLEATEAALGSTTSSLAERINISAQPEKKRCALALAISRGLMTQGNFQAIDALLEYCPESEAEEVRAKANEMLKKETEIGLALPLSGELQKYGESILDGALLAAQQYARETGRELRPTIYDTKGESVEAGRIVKKLMSSGAAAAIGPLTSEETAVVSAVLSCSDLPLIAPAAGQGGLTELSSTCFQLQPPVDRQGVRMAEFAANKLGFDTAVIIAPTSADNMRMADAFAKEFQRLGGAVIAMEYFRPRETDFGELIGDIKALALGPAGDSAVYIAETGDTIETKEVPAVVECLYIPAEPSQLQQLLPQLNFYNLRAVYLGGEGWGDKSVAALGEDIYKECYFSSSRLDFKSAPGYGKFYSDFSKKYKRDPGYLEALGYDAMRLICQALKADNYSRTEIVHYLSAIRDYRGLAGSVSFDDKRQNTAMPVYTIVKGELRAADKP